MAFARDALAYLYRNKGSGTLLANVQQYHNELFESVRLGTFSTSVSSNGISVSQLSDKNVSPAEVLETVGEILRKITTAAANGCTTDEEIYNEVMFQFEPCKSYTNSFRNLRNS